METLSILIALFAFIAFILGMIKPQWVLKFGIKPKRKTVAFIYVGLFVIALIMMPNSNLASESSNDGSGTTVQDSQTKELTSSIGKESEVGYYTYTINKFEYKKTVGNEFTTQTADGIFLLVYLTIKNTSTETHTLDGSSFYITDQNDVKFEYSVDGSTALEMSGEESLFLKECHPRIKTSGVLIFEVPEKADYYLNLAGDFFGTSTVKILLK